MLLGYTWYQYETILLIIVRVTALLAVAPVFSDRRIPAYAKIGFGVILGILIVSVIPLAASHYTTTLAFSAAIIRESLVGVTIGYTANLLFMGIQFSGQFVSLQMGFAAAQLFDPSSQTNVPVVGEFYYIMAVLLYLIIGGQRFLIEALRQSFDVIPLNTLRFHDTFFMYLTQLSADVFVIAMKIAAPIFITILLTEVSLGLLARLVPQMNIFIFGFPLKILAGMLMIAISMPIFGRVFQQLYLGSQSDILRIIQMLKP